MSEQVTTSEELVRQRLAERLTQLAIDAPIVPYPAHSTVEEGKRLRDQMQGSGRPQPLVQVVLRAAMPSMPMWL